MKRETGVLLAFAFAGWAFCSAIMGILPPLVGMRTALAVHLVAGPIAFAALAASYQRRVGAYSPRTVATVFLAFVVAMDFFVVSLAVLGDLRMFRSVVGSWVPFALIFLASWGAGARARSGRHA